MQSQVDIVNTCDVYLLLVLSILWVASINRTQSAKGNNHQTTALMENVLINDAQSLMGADV